MLRPKATQWYSEIVWIIITWIILCHMVPNLHHVKPQKATLDLVQLFVALKLLHWPKFKSMGCWSAKTLYTAPSLPIKMDPPRGRQRMKSRGHVRRLACSNREELAPTTRGLTGSQAGSRGRSLFHLLAAGRYCISCFPISCARGESSACDVGICWSSPHCVKVEESTQL